jgi:Flp pilus assembly pilin Flp
MVRRLVADENGLSNLKWALLIAAVAVAAVMYFPQLSFVTAALQHFWSWLSLPMVGR